MNNKTILLTGGTGTIGNYIIEELFKNYNPKKVIIFSRDEMKQHTMKIQNKDNKRLEFVIGDVRNFEALNRAFRNVNVVIHAAAMKHVPICEENPEEAVLTNILGAKNIINAAINFQDNALCMLLSYPLLQNLIPLQQNMEHILLLKQLSD